MEKERSPLNKTLTLSNEESAEFGRRLLTLTAPAAEEELCGKTIHQDMLEAVRFLPDACVDLLFLDPPYNLKKNFHGAAFSAMSIQEYSEYIASWLGALVPKLKPGASVYFCGDYFSSTSIHLEASKHFIVRNRVTWQREKGRGAKTNWKNGSEDIWFCTVSEKYKFYVDRVKEKRRVIAPYRVDGKPKDWEETADGNFRLTYPSNIWTDLSIPYWSMPENTEHPTQKPEKLLAKIILASSDEGDIVLDPFLGSGTTSVVAKKLNRRFIGIEQNREYCLFAEKRLRMADSDSSIQGYSGGVFWERNTGSEQGRKKQKRQTLFDEIE